MTIQVTEQPTPWRCAECGEPVVLRTERVDTSEGTIVRRRQHACAAVTTHAIGDLTT